MSSTSSKAGWKTRPPILFCDLCTAIVENLRRVRKFPALLIRWATTGRPYFFVFFAFFVAKFLLSFGCGFCRARLFVVKFSSSGLRLLPR
jgi:hypothetical protein